MIIPLVVTNPASACARHLSFSAALDLTDKRRERPCEAFASRLSHEAVHAHEVCEPFLSSSTSD